MVRPPTALVSAYAPIAARPSRPIHPQQRRGLVCLSGSFPLDKLIARTSLEVGASFARWLPQPYHQGGTVPGHHAPRRGDDWRKSLAQTSSFCDGSCAAAHADRIKPLSRTGLRSYTVSAQIRSRQLRQREPSLAVATFVFRDNGVTMQLRQRATQSVRC